MFKKFVPKESVSSMSQLKSSAQRGVRSNVLAQFPTLEDDIENILPKKATVMIAKCQNHINIVCIDNEPLFFNSRDGPYFPTLRVLHKYPDMLPHMRIDKGGIKFIMSGANVMCPGLTSKGGEMADVPIDCPVAVMAEGKERAMAVGVTTMSSADIKSINKGIGIELCHYLNDGLWKNPKLD